jgi:integrase
LVVSTEGDTRSEVMASHHNHTPTLSPHPGLTRLDQVREVLRSSHDADRTEQAYGHWIRRSLHACGGTTHPHRLGATEVERVLSHLATEGQVAASGPRQALTALVCLSREVLHTPLARAIAPVRRTRHQRPPSVRTQAEVPAAARRLSGGGLRLRASLRLRTQDVDVGQHLIGVRGGTGGQDRTSLRPRNLRDAVQAPLEAVNALHHQDLAADAETCPSPRHVPGHTQRPRGRPAGSGCFRPGRASGLHTAVTRAAVQARRDTPVGCQTLRHRCGTHRREHGVTIRVLQDLLGPAEVKTTERYTPGMARDTRP